MIKHEGALIEVELQDSDDNNMQQQQSATSNSNYDKLLKLHPSYEWGERGSEEGAVSH